jgi:putative peptide maturation system protein
MSCDLTPALTDTLECLRALRRERGRPDEARARVRRLARAHAPVAIDLVWEEEACDESVHYDALLHLEGVGTVSLSFCPAGALPWPLRGVQRLNDKDLLRVNRTLISVSEAVAMLDFIWGEAPILERLINLALIREELERNPVEVTDADVQSALDAFRRAHRLLTAADTHRWLEEHAMTHAGLEELLTYQASVARLRDQVSRGRIEVYFAAHRADFDMARIARLACQDAAVARRIVERVRGGGSDFYTEAEQTGQADLRFAVVTRRGGPEELSAAVFGAAPGEVAGPIPTPEGHLVVRVLSVAPARLDENTRGAVRQALFDEWLAERRRAARVEWYWGSAAGG